MSEYQLSWTSFKNSLCNGLSQLQQKEEFVDMTLAADGHLVKVHRNIMSLASPYIKEMLQSTSCRDPVVFLNNVSYQVLSYILEYIYTGEVKVPKYTLNTFMKAAKSLHITGIKDLVVPMGLQEFSQSLPENFSKRHGRHAKLNADVEKRSFMDSETENAEPNEGMHPLTVDDKQLVANGENQSVANYEKTSKLEDNIGPLTHIQSIDIDCDDNYSNNLDGMDVDMAQQQIVSTQKQKQKSILERAMENTCVLDANEADKVKYKANITLNFEDNESSRLQNDTENITYYFEEDGDARFQNHRESAAPNVNFEFQSCARRNANEYPSVSISVNKNTQQPERDSKSLASLINKDETHDASAPLYSISERGSLQIILNRFIYNVHHSSHSNNKHRWRCTDYRKLNCKAYIDTFFDEIVERQNEHTHGFHDAKILKKGKDQNIYSTKSEAEEVSEAEK